MVEYLGEFVVMHKEIVNSDGRCLKLHVSGPKGQEVAYCKDNIDATLRILADCSEISIDGVRIKSRKNGRISISRIRIGLNKLYEKYMQKFVDYGFNLQDDMCSRLFHMIHKDRKLMSLFVGAPESNDNKYNYFGGLLVHTCELFETAALFAKMDRIGKYINYDHLITGILLVNIGKAKCYRMTERGFQVTHTGLYIGAVSSSHKILLENAAKLGEIDEPVLQKLENIILHHSPDGNVLARSVEARIIYDLQNDRVTEVRKNMQFNRRVVSCSIWNMSDDSSDAG